MPNGRSGTWLMAIEAKMRLKAQENIWIEKPKSSLSAIYEKKKKRIVF